MFQSGQYRRAVILLFLVVFQALLPGLTKGQQSQLEALPAMKDLNGYFPFRPPNELEAWAKRKSHVRRQLQVALGLWPLPINRPTVEPTIHGLINQDGYTIEKVYFDNGLGLYVTGNLYKPKKIDGKIPGVLCPHGHFRNGRFGKQSDRDVQKAIAEGGETFESNTRNVIQARAANLAKMGCVVFVYDMIGYADSQQINAIISHGFAKQRLKLATPERWGLYSPQAESNLQTVMGLQTWNSIRALDFLESLPEVDAQRLGVTGASGGGTQTFILCALDDRPKAAFPAVMVSTAMQGGCTCENCAYLRIGTGNVEFAGMFAPKPLGLTAANDWTKEMETKGYPELKKLYELFQAPQHLHMTSRLEFGHNFNQVSREAMYRWFKTHLEFDGEPVESEIDFLSQNELTVFDDTLHSRPKGGEAFEVGLLKRIAERDRKLLEEKLFSKNTTPEDFEETIGGFLDVVSACGRESLGDAKYVELKADNAAIARFDHTFSIGQSGGKGIFRENHPNPSVAFDVLLLDRNGSLPSDSDSLSNDLFQQLQENNIGVQTFRGPWTGRKEPARRVNNPREAAGYTLGYNAPELVQRALTWRPNTKHMSFTPASFVVALDRSVLEVAVNAHQLANDPNIAGVVVNTSGFRFDKINDIRDPDLLPGASKYYDLPGLLSMLAPKPLLLIGEDETSARIVVRAYAVNGKKQNLTLVEKMDDEAVTTITNWIKENAKQ